MYGTPTKCQDWSPERGTRMCNIYTTPALCSIPSEGCLALGLRHNTPGWGNAKAPRITECGEGKDNVACQNRARGTAVRVANIYPVRLHWGKPRRTAPRAAGRAPWELLSQRDDRVVLRAPHARRPAKGTEKERQEENKEAALSSNPGREQSIKSKPLCGQGLTFGCDSKDFLTRGSLGALRAEKM